MAVNLYTVREADTSAGRLYRSIQKQKEQYQGFWIVSPQGKVLTGHQDFRSEETWPQEVYAVLERGLRNFGSVTPRKISPTDSHPFRGVGVQPDGKVTLSIFIREPGPGGFLGPGVLDSLTLTAAEFKAFTPPANETGTRWNVDSQVARQLCRCLSLDSDLVNMPLPKEVTAVKLVGEVHSVRDDVVTLTYQGHIAATHAHLYEKGLFNRGRAAVTGTARYDSETGGMLSLMIVMEGDFHNFQPYDREPRRLIAGIEWQSKK